MLNRLFGRGGNTRQQATWGSAPATDPVADDGPQAVLRVLRNLPEVDWVRLAAVDFARQADAEATTREDRIYQAAQDDARRRGEGDRLARTVTLTCEEATTIAKAAAGPESAAAFSRFEAVVQGRAGLIADATEAPAVSRYLGFIDAATNAVRAAAFRPYLSAADHDYLWRGYASVLDFTAPVADAPAPAALPEDTDRELFGLASSAVLNTLVYLQEAKAEKWVAIVVAHQELAREADGAGTIRLRNLVNRGGARGMEGGFLTEQDVKDAKRLAEEAAAGAVDRVADLMATRSPNPKAALAESFGPPMRTAANALITSVLVLPYLDAEEASDLWSTWTVIQPRPPLHG